MFSVEKIIKDIVILENLETSEIVKIEKKYIDNVKESDILTYKQGKYEYSEEETLKRKNEIKDLKNKLKIFGRG